MKNKEGEMLHKRILIRIVPPAGMKGERITVAAPPRAGYGMDAVLSVLEDVAEKLERQNPAMEFRLVELAPNRFNFVYAGLRSEPIAKAS
jgi:hypothetical protein